MKNLLLLLSVFTLSTQSMAQIHGSDATSPSTIRAKTRFFEGIMAGSSNKMFIGGRSPEGFISWNAYPDNNNNIPGHEYRYLYSDASAARIGYANWAGQLEFQFSNSTPSFGAAVSWSTLLRLSSDGKMRLCGEMLAQTVTVDALGGWCDYVFSPSYKLMPLESLSRYILVNRHLPEIPSEKEITEKGIDLGAMQTLQMKKIEELTLYVLQLKAEIDELKSQICD